MKKKLPSPKAPLPTFQSDEAAAKYFETHSVAELWQELAEVKPSKPSKPLAKSIRERHATAKSPISIRLDPKQNRGRKENCGNKIGRLSEQLRIWIAEGIHRELKRQ